ncbi:MAG: dTDP-4-dehydrorhamnose 3,5-epimerase family protein [Terriglobales bacterium]|jgi:dTDP-4-dehydrorhamnose 3,5-epimerase
MNRCVDELLLPTEKDTATPGPRAHPDCQLTQPPVIIAGDRNAAVPGMKQGACMGFMPTGVVGALSIDPILREDDRGHFARAWCKREFAEQGIDFVPVQANTGLSVRKGTLRGMHFQVEPALEAKLISCTRGAIFDVVLDLRPESPSYRKWYGAELSAANRRMLYIPERCAHGYQTLEDCTDVYYMASQYYTPSAARGVRFDDPAFGIQWPLAATAMSEQDRNWPLVSGASHL